MSKGKATFLHKFHSNYQTIKLRVILSVRQPRRILKGFFAYSIEAHVCTHPYRSALAINKILRTLSRLRMTRYVYVWVWIKCGGIMSKEKVTLPHKPHVCLLISVILSVRQPRRILKGFFAYLIATYTHHIIRHSQYTRFFARYRGSE